MKNSLIYNMEVFDNTVLKKRVTILLDRNFKDQDTIKLGSLPQPRDGHSAHLFMDKMIIFGGDRNKFPFNDLFVFNLH